MSRSRYPYSAFIGPALGLCGCLGLLEIGLRLPAASRFLPLPSPYYSDEVMDRDRVLKEFLDKKGVPEVLIIGSSIARSNVMADKLSDGLGKRVFGLGLSALSPGSAKLMYEKHWQSLLPTGSARALIVVRPSDFQYQYSTKTDETLPKGRIERGWLDPEKASILDAPWMPRLKLADYYGALSKVLSSRRPIRGPAFPVNAWGATQFVTGYGLEAMTGEKEAAISAKVRVQVEPLSVSQTHSNTLAILKDFNRVLGGRSVLVLCPEYVKTWKNPEERFAWREDFRRLIEREGLVILMPDAEGFDSNPTNFSDFTHYSEAGARQFTELLNDEIDHRGGLDSIR